MSQLSNCNNLSCGSPYRSRGEGVIVSVSYRDENIFSSVVQYGDRIDWHIPDKILSVPECQQNLTFSYTLSLRVHGALLLQPGSTIQQSEKKFLLLLMRFIDNGTFLCSLLIIVCLIISKSSSKTRWSEMRVHLRHGFHNKMIFPGKSKSRSFLLSYTCYFSSTKHTFCADTTDL